MISFLVLVAVVFLSYPLTLWMVERVHHGQGSTVSFGETE